MIVLADRPLAYVHVANFSLSTEFCPFLFVRHLIRFVFMLVVNAKQLQVMSKRLSPSRNKKQAGIFEPTCLFIFQLSVRTRRKTNLSVTGKLRYILRMQSLRGILTARFI